MKKMPPRFGRHSKGALGMENEIYGQRARFAVYLTNGLLYYRLHTLAAEYSLPVEQLADLAVKRLIDDVDLVRSLRNGKVAGV